MDTQNYFFREIEASDITNIYRGLSDPEITKYYDVHFPTLEATQEQMNWYNNLKEEETGIWWGVYGKLDKQFRGACGFNALSKTHKRAEIGLWLFKEYWGQGILKEVMPRVFEEGFLSLDLNRIEGFVHSDNQKCKRALEKVNFTYEGTMRAFEIKNGKRIDLDIYSILKQEWKVNLTKTQ